MYSDLLNILLEKRGVLEDDKKNIFLNPDWNRDLLDPLNIKDMDKAIERIKKAINTNEKIVIYSDYDCDGIPGGVVLYDFFTSINFTNFTNYIPHRHKEGYGIHISALDTFIKDKVSLIITVDLGITNIKEIDYANTNNIDIILTDHHLPIRDENNQQILPKAFAVINTKRDDCLYKEEMLCGCATAWKLACAFIDKYGHEYNLKKGIEKWWLDMVAISTIADMVPLQGENRLLAKYGLEVLKKTKRIGLKKIFNNAKIDQNKINETDISFGIAPRLNAAGRISDPREAFLSLLNNQDSIIYAEKIEQYNKQRKDETKQANMMINFETLNTEDIIIVGDPEWRSGILGLIASNISEKTTKTVFVWGGLENNIAKGSVRAGKDGANVVDLMSKCDDVLEQFGGHEEAGGFAIKLENIDLFKTKLKNEYKKCKNNFIKKDETITEDFILDIKDINNDLYKQINTLAPFGISNKKPIFKIRNDYKGHRLFGDKKQHLEILIGNLSLIKYNNNILDIDFYKNSEYLLVEMDWDKYKNKIQLKSPK